METQSSKSPEKLTGSIEALEQGEIIVPKEIVHAFGRGLRQLLKKPMGETIRELTLLEPFSKIADKTQKGGVDVMKEALQKCTEVVNQLEHAKEVRIVPFANGYDLAFSEAKEKANPEKGTLIMDEDLAPKFAVALSHVLHTHIGVVMGNSTMIQDYSKDENARKQGLEVYCASFKVDKRLNSLTKKAHEFEIMTNDKGKTTINPIPHPKTEVPQIK
jgi:hypothetical protein